MKAGKAADLMETTFKSAMTRFDKSEGTNSTPCADDDFDTQRRKRRSFMAMAGLLRLQKKPSSAARLSFIGLPSV